MKRGTVYLYALACLGAFLGTSADAACIAGVRGWHPRAMFAFALLANAGMTPVAWAMTRETGGRFVTFITAWSVAATVFNAGFALWSGDQQTRTEWFSFALALAAVVVRALGKASP